MPLKQSLDNARPADFAEVLARTGPALASLRRQHENGTLPLLGLPQRTDDIADILESAHWLRDGASDLVFLGTGGSSLGGQTLAQLADYAVPGLGLLRRPRLHFLDNLDPETLVRLLKRIPLPETRFVAISKSGGTGETLMQTAAALRALLDAGCDPHDHFIGLSEPAAAGRRNGLRELLAPWRVRFLEHDTGVGGRFSVLTNVGLLPAAVCGLDVAAIRAGAANALAPILDGHAPEQVPAAGGAALAAALAPHKPMAVMMAYADRLERFSRWYVQLWAESLGKDGKGTTPLAALGPVDQHSQLQLFIAGPRDKLFTIITSEIAGQGPRIDAELAGRAGEPDFADRTVGDLVAAQGRATAETLVRNGCPVRTIQLERIDEASVGELLMHFMLETIVTAHLFGVDPFDQPAVEEGKILAKSYLAGSVSPRA